MTDAANNKLASRQVFKEPNWWRSVQAWLRTDGAARWLLALIVIVGAFLRLTHLNWDQGWHIHPDERFLTMVTSAMRLPDGLKEFFDSTRSPMNPHNVGFGFFVYGTLPLFIVRVVAEVANKSNAVVTLWEVAPGIPLNLTGYDGVHLVGRALSGLFDVASVWLTFVIARRLFGRKAGLLAAVLYAFAPLALQQSHFFTVDTFATFFALLTFYFAVRVAQGSEAERRGGGWVAYAALGASLGASLACRINLAPMAAIAVLAALIRVWDDWRVAGVASRAQIAWLSTLLQATLFRLLLMGLVAIAFFRLLQPYAFGGTSLFDFTLADGFRDSMRTISRIIRGDADQPPMHQWANRTPFVFPWVNMVVWGMGLASGLAAWTGWVAALSRILRGLTVRPDPGAVKQLLLPVAWVGGMFLYHSMQFSYTMRYYLPIYPFLLMLGAWLLWWLVEKVKAYGRMGVWAYEGDALPHPQTRIQRLRRISVPAIYALLVVVTIFTILWGWGFLAIYRRPLSRITASEWIYANIPEGSVVANEHWDDPLPGGVEGKIGFKPMGAYYGLTDPNSGRREGQIENYWEDVPEKRERLYQWLNEADAIVMSSNRLWGSIPRLPMRYPMTTLYYQLMAEEKLGFELAARFTSFPTIFGIRIDDTGAEEAFSVYDHPEVRIYRKTPAYSEPLARSYFDAIDLENTIQMWPKQVTQAPTALYFTEAEAVTQRSGGTWTAIFDLDGLLNRSPALAVVTWLALLLLLGVITFPLAFVALRGLADRGYGISKTLGMLLLAWLTWLGPSLRFVPYARWWIALCLGLLMGLSAAIGWRRRHAIIAFVRQRRSLLLTEEAIFLILFGLFLLIRIGNPDLWHPARGGEKPMDLAYLNAVIRSTTFPPYDPWHAGGFINYYYFGFVIVGTLIKLTGIVPWVAYNLAVPTLFGLAGVGAFAVAFSLADGDRATEFPNEEEPYQGLRIGSLLAGLAGVFFVTIIGNLGNVKLLADQLAGRSALQLESTTLGLAKLLRAITGGFAVLTGKEQLAVANDWWFWNATRTIPDTINEFPFFTFTYADLHAHMIALPLALLALAAAVALVRAHSTFHIPYSTVDIPDSPFPIAEPSPWCIPLPELLPIGLLGLVIGALRATNTWDFPTYTLVGLAAILVLEVARRGRMPGWAGVEVTLPERLAFLFRAAVSVVWRTGIMLAVATVTFVPYTQHYATAYGGLQSWKEAKTTIPDYLTVWGFFLVVGAIYLISELIAQRQARRNGDASLDSRHNVAHGADPLSMTAGQRARLVAETTSSVTLSGTAGQSAPRHDTSEGSRVANGDASLDSRRDAAHGADPLSITTEGPGWLWDNVPSVIVATVLLVAGGWVMGVRVWLIALPLFVLAVFLALGRNLPPARRLGLLLLALALAITMGVEVIRLKDDIGRMNTVFKFYMQAWTLFGVSMAFGLASWLPRAFAWRPGWRKLAWGVTLVLFVGALLYPATAARAKIRDRFSAEASPRGLDGMAYMDRAQYFDNGRDLRLADDKAAMLWLLTNVQGSPVILEAQTPEYRWGSRFSIYTGLPAVQGWNWHQRQQRSVVPAVVERRVQQAQELYNTTDLARAKHLLDTYQVSYIIVGELERAYYTPEGLAKFGLLVDQGYLRGAYVGGSVIIYEVVARAATAQTPPEPAASGHDSPLPTPATFASPVQ